MRVHMLFRNLIETIFEKANIDRKYIGIWSRFIGIDRWHRAQTGYRMYVYSKTVTVQFRRRSCPIDDSCAYLYIYGRIVSFIRVTTSCKVPTLNFILFRICASLFTQNKKINFGSYQTFFCNLKSTMLRYRKSRRDNLDVA